MTLGWSFRLVSTIAAPVDICRVSRCFCLSSTVSLAAFGPVLFVVRVSGFVSAFFHLVLLFVAGATAVIHTFVLVVVTVILAVTLVNSRLLSLLLSSHVGVLSFVGGHAHRGCRYGCCRYQCPRSCCFSLPPVDTVVVIVCVLPPLSPRPPFPLSGFHYYGSVVSIAVIAVIIAVVLAVFRPLALARWCSRSVSSSSAFRPPC